MDGGTRTIGNLVQRLNYKDGGGKMEGKEGTTQLQNQGVNQKD